MKNVSRSIIVLFLLLCMKCTGLAHDWANNMAVDSCLNEYHVESEKIYIQPDQLHINNQGIYILIQGELMFVSQLNCDEGGLYCLTRV